MLAQEIPLLNLIEVNDLLKLLQVRAVAFELILAVSRWRALIMKPRLLVLDEPTEGIQPSIIKDIGRVIALLRSRGEMAILLVEQYFDFAQELAQTMVIMDRGDVVLSGRREELDEQDVRRRLSV